MTAKKISSRDGVTILLAGVTLIIMVLALVSMVNYYQFLPALAQFEVKLSSMDWRLVDQNTVVFLDRFRTILKAYQTGAMKYGCFIARKPD